MKNLLSLFITFLLISCGSRNLKQDENTDFVIAFGSCNHQYDPQPLWQPILKNQPDVFLWGGDNIYSDTDDAARMKAEYQQQLDNKDYQQILAAMPVLATWDDHDYGLNDGGREWHFKDTSQQLFLDFMKVPNDSPRRSQKGVYSSEVFETEKGSVKIILLDTRYFRSELKKSEDPNRRFEPSEGTMLGAEQWDWLENELKNSDAGFHIILSSVQVLSGEHGFESWGNFPSEVEKLENLIVSSEAKNVILLSGDRHISEFSEAVIPGLDYPLMDFTSSGLTHTYEEFSGEPNKYRKGFVVKDKSFGIIRLNFEENSAILEMRGENNKLQQEYQLDFQ